MCIYARAHAQSDDPDHIQFFFKTNISEDAGREAMNKTILALQEIAKECKAGSNGKTTVSCADDINMCTGETVAYADVGGSRVRICKRAFDLGAKGSGCRNPGLANTMVHELSHALASFDDFGGSYGRAGIESLKPEQNRRHADSVALYALAVTKNCSADELQGGTTNGTGAGEPPQVWTKDWRTKSREPGFGLFNDTESEIEEDTGAETSSLGGLNGTETKTTGDKDAGSTASELGESNSTETSKVLKGANSTDPESSSGLDGGVRNNEDEDGSLNDVSNDESSGRAQPETKDKKARKTLRSLEPH